METPKIISRDIMEKGRFLSLLSLSLLHPDNKIKSYECLERNSDKVFWIVSILPITKDGHVIMTRQYRAPIDRVQLELPAWCAEVGMHDSLEEAARAELREETGYESEKLTHVAEFSSSAGMTSETVHGYIAENCRKVTDILSLDQNEYIEPVIVPYSEFDQLIFSELASGRTVDPKLLALMYYFRTFIVKDEKKLISKKNPLL